MRELPFKRVETEMVCCEISACRSLTDDGQRAGTAPPSIAADLLQNGLNGSDVPTDDIRDIAGVFYVGACSI